MSRTVSSDLTGSARRFAARIPISNHVHYKLTSHRGCVINPCPPERGNSNLPFRSFAHNATLTPAAAAAARNVDPSTIMTSRRRPFQLRARYRGSYIWSSPVPVDRG